MIKKHFICQSFDEKKLLMSVIEQIKDKTSAQGSTLLSQCCHKFWLKQQRTQERGALMGSRALRPGRFPPH